ncbi:uncharacterized protein LOC111637555 [Centruroides sculpturatus]|uniref:uncharacterized protein LOC111637555 n=1 Tax=Centruroides sculpturatus TaxID=218467 RepID=UPI000C6D2EE5|nr:uncharacterized protein LOC111637555 [Centruroides sculpturatus]
MDNFYVTLISTASMDFFPKNTQSSFTSKINPPINLTGSWEVGLSQIIIPRSWFNITSENNKYVITTKEMKLIKIKAEDLSTLIPLQPMQGNNSSHIFENITNNLKVLKKDHFINFSFNKDDSTVKIYVANDCELRLLPDSGGIFLSMLNLDNQNPFIIQGEEELTFRYTPSLQDFSGEFFTLIEKNRYVEEIRTENVENILQIPRGLYGTKDFLKAFQIISFKSLPDKKLLLKIPRGSSVKFNKQLKDILGFDQLEYPEGEFIGTYPLELNAGITEIFVYSNIIESHHVGDTSAPLFRVIPLMGEKEQQIDKIYNTPLFFPVRTNHIETISIDLRSSTGENIIFTSGKSLLVLYFRRV